MGVLTYQTLVHKMATRGIVTKINTKIIRLKKLVTKHGVLFASSSNMQACWRSFAGNASLKYPGGVYVCLV